MPNGTPEGNVNDLAAATDPKQGFPRRMSGTCAKHQRELSKAIKRARVAALLPFKGE